MLCESDWKNIIEQQGGQNIRFAFVCPRATTSPSSFIKELVPGKSGPKTRRKSRKPTFKRCSPRERHFNGSTRRSSSIVFANLPRTAKCFQPANGAASSRLAKARRLGILKTAAAIIFLCVARRGSFCLAKVGPLQATLTATCRPWPMPVQ